MLNFTIMMVGRDLWFSSRDDCGLVCICGIFYSIANVVSIYHYFIVNNLCVKYNSKISHIIFYGDFLLCLVDEGCPLMSSFPRVCRGDISLLNLVK